MVNLIAYDLHKPERDYADVIAAIKELGAWAKVEESVWLVDTITSTGDCRDKVRDAARSEATVFVGRLHRDWGSFGVDSDVVDWLNAPARTW